MGREVSCVYSFIRSAGVVAAKKKRSITPASNILRLTPAAIHYHCVLCVAPSWS